MTVKQQHISPFAQVSVQAGPEGYGGLEELGEGGNNEEGRWLWGAGEGRREAALEEGCVAFRVTVTTREAGELPYRSRVASHVDMGTE